MHFCGNKCIKCFKRSGGSKAGSFVGDIHFTKQASFAVQKSIYVPIFFWDIHRVSKFLCFKKIDTLCLDFFV